jgi:hypothetical protein
LIGCARENYKPIIIPPYPIAGPAVAAELEEMCKNKNKCKAIFEWLNRLAVFKDQLEACKENND